ERAALRQEVEKTHRELADLRKEKDALTAQHAETTSTQQRQLEEERAGLRQEVEKARRELADLSKEKDTLAAQHTEIKTAQQNAAQLSKNEVDRLNETLNQARLEKETAQQQQRALDEQVRSLKAQLDQKAGAEGEYHNRLTS